MRSTPPATLKQLLSASGLALATALVAAGPSLRAQSLQGTVDSTFGSVSVFATLGVTEVSVNSPSAVINWTPTDVAATGGPINFQPVGTTATFTGSSSLTDFTVLNRIVPSGSTRPIQFNGTVRSFVQQASGPQVTGGKVFFYSPGGILVGASGVFDVGGLVLTTSDLNYDASGNFQSNGGYAFQQATVPGSQIVVSAGAQLGASPEGSYIALVAPSITSNGTITVNGAAALVAADAATITFSPSGLFDIVVDSGTSATGTVVSNNGTITGPAAADPTFFHRVYMVAVPKNDAITMALGAGSTLGFDIAGAADVDGNTIILSAGYDVLGGNPAFGPSNGGGDGTASVTGMDAAVTSNFVASATGGVNLGSGSGAGLSFASNAFLKGAGGNSSLFTTPDGEISAAGNVTIVGDVQANDVGVAANAFDTTIVAAGGSSITIGGNVRLSSTGFGAASIEPGFAGGAATGGTASLQALTGGTVSVQGNVVLEAMGLGGGAQVGGAGGGDGTGGTAAIIASGTGGSLVEIFGGLSADASGFGASGTGCSSCLRDGGNGAGGLVAITADGGLAGVTVGMSTQIAAQGDGGGSFSHEAGAGQGGNVALSASNGGSLTLAATQVFASGSGGTSSAVAGVGTGGDISVIADGSGMGGIFVSEVLMLTADGFGGFGGDVAGIGGVSTGGNIVVRAQNEKIIGIDGGLRASAGASGNGGFGGAGAATGGTVLIEATSAGFVAVSQDLEIAANAEAGSVSDNAIGADAFGGDAAVIADGGDIAVAGPVLVSANALGGSLGGQGTAGSGGGGTARVDVMNNGLLSVNGDMTVAATGRGGSETSFNDGTGGSGRGGNASVRLDNGTYVNTASLAVSAEGYGGTGSAVGGAGEGGATLISLADSSFTVEGTSYLGATGTGGFGGISVSAGTAGEALGGSLTMLADNSTASFGTNDAIVGDSPGLTIETTAFGGGGSTPAAATGGSVLISVDASAIVTPGEIAIFSEGQGSIDSMSGGPGGLGTGGDIAIALNGDPRGLSSIVADALTLSASGRGGDGSSGLFGGMDGGDGGTGIGGAIRIDTAPDGGLLDLRLLNIGADGVGGTGGQGAGASGFGGAGGSGGAAFGGDIAIGSRLGSGTLPGGLYVTNATISASAVGGNGADGGFGFPEGPTGGGGAALGGNIIVAADAGGSELRASGEIALRANASGGSTGLCFVSCPVMAGAATGGTITIGSNGLTTGNVIAADRLTLSAFGQGGDSNASSGAAGTGGSALVNLGSGLTFSAGSVSLEVSGEGGAATADELPDLAGSSGQGGNAQFVASLGSVATIDDSIMILASGSGGGAVLAPGATGGDGTGGTARLHSDGGVITVGNTATLEANGFGGHGFAGGPSGAGGTGLGGSALLTVGTPQMSGNGGAITIGTEALAKAEGLGGSGFVAGSGIGGLSAVVARQGSVQMGQVFVSANGSGGNGTGGGTGGLGQAGAIEIFAHNADGGPSLLQATSLVATAEARGGAGAGFSASTNAAGIGGAAEGGVISVLGSAGNGTVNITTLEVSADAYGGLGGGAELAPGGTGGAAMGGSVQFGVASGMGAEAVNAGGAQFGTITASANGLGGQGGGSEILGGSGGDAVGGGISLIARGALVRIDSDSTFAANALGGSGGSGATISNGGNGGNAMVSGVSGAEFISGVALLVTNRFNQPGQRGSLQAAGLSFSASGSGGSGTINGTSTIANNATRIEVVNSDFVGTNLLMIADADAVSALAAPDSMLMMNGSANLSGTLAITTPNAFSLTLDNAGATAGTVMISAGNWIGKGQGTATPGTLTGTSLLNLSSGLDLVADASLQSDEDIFLTAQGRIGLGTVRTLGDMSAVAGSAIVMGDVAATGAIGVSASGNAMLGDLSSGATISLASTGGAVQAGNVSAVGSIAAHGASGLAFGNVSGSAVTLNSATSITVGDVAAGTGGLGVFSGGTVQGGNLVSGRDVFVVATGDIGTGAVQGNDALLLGGGSVAAGALSLAGRGLIANAANAVPGGPQAPNAINKEAIFAAVPVATNGAVSIAGASTVGSVRIAAGTTVSAASVQAGGNIGVTSTGNGSFDLLSSTNGNVEVIAQSGVITAATINAGLNAAVRSGGGLDLGFVSGRVLALLSGADVRVGTVLAGAISDTATGQVTGAIGHLRIANASMLADNAQPGSVNYTALLSATPVASGGTVVIDNAAIAGQIVSASSGGMTGGAMTGYERITVLSGGAVNVAQRWFAPVVRIVGGDIGIVDNGAGLLQVSHQTLSGIRTTQDGTVDIVSTSGSPALIGDGLTGGGFRLSNAEIGLISTGNLFVGAADVAANPIDMVIGQIDLTAGGDVGGNTVAGAAGRIIFATGNAATLQPSGTIRVTGAINGTGFGSGNVLEFSTGRFELDAATGLISLASAGGTPGGIAEFNATHIHVASSDILAKLAANPLYDGRIADLNAPATVQRPNGVLRALGLDFYPGGTLYIQNTGTVLNPAGFFADIDFTDVSPPGNATAGSVAVVVNGAFQTPDGIVGGAAAHDLAIAQATDLAPFAADSQINGCLFTIARCVTVPEPPREPDVPPVVGAISGQFEVILSDPIGTTPGFAEEPADEGNEPEDSNMPASSSESGAAAGPIVPPINIIDDSPLDPVSRIEEPVTGGGNPAFYGSNGPDAPAQGDDH